MILKWAMHPTASPRVIIMENVEEIQTWGPLKEIDGKTRPDPEHIGETFNGFVAMLTDGISKDSPAFEEACEFLGIEAEGEDADRLARGLGYKVDWRTLKACDYGAPTIRKRFYLVARRDGLPIQWPAPTHGKGLKPYRTAAECIDWSIPCPSIFERGKPLAENTLRRIARGLDKFVIKNKRPFIVSGDCAPSFLQYHSEQGGGEVRGQTIDKPIMTIDGSPRYAINLCVLRKNTDCKDLRDSMPTITTSAGHMAQTCTYLVKAERVTTSGTGRRSGNY